MGSKWTNPSGESVTCIKCNSTYPAIIGTCDACAEEERERLEMEAEREDKK